MEAKRTSTSTSNDTEQRLLDAAQREFAARGYDGASLRQICSAAGVTTGALYFFFQNKEDLFRRVLSPLTAPIQAALAREAGAAHDKILSTALDVLKADGGASVLHRLLSLSYAQRDVALVFVANRQTAPVKEVLCAAREAIVVHVREALLSSGSDLSVLDPLVKDWLADLAVNAYVDILTGDEDLETACRHMSVVLGFVRAGVAALLDAEKGKRFA